MSNVVKFEPVNKVLLKERERCIQNAQALGAVGNDKAAYATINDWNKRQRLDAYKIA